jgi:CBS domain-containing protein
MKVKDIMTKDIVSVNKDMSVKAVAELMTEKKIRGVPVVDAQGRLEGIVTESDLVFRDKRIHIPTMIALFGSVIYLESPAHLKDELTKMLGARVEDIMTKKVVTVTEDTDIEDAASMMTDKKFDILPVMSETKLVGIITRADIVKSIAKE